MLLEKQIHGFLGVSQDLAVRYSLKFLKIHDTLIRKVKNRSSGISKNYQYGINIYLHKITIPLN